jgi:hypothetical protein
VAGGDAVVTGSGCPSGAPVDLRIEDAVVGTARADAQGRFEAPVDVGSLSVGRHVVQAECGGARLEAPIDVVISTSTSGVSSSDAAAAAGVLCFFVLLLQLLTQGRGAPDPIWRRG